MDFNQKMQPVKPVRSRLCLRASTLFLLVIAAGFTGCQWVGITDRVTPQVCGRVLDANTQQPIAGVRVVPVIAGQSAPATAETGAQRLMQGRPILTDTNGDFVFPSRDYVTFLRRSGGASIRLSFQKFRYLTLQTNFAPAAVSQQALSGIPRVDAGTILLQPVSP